MTKRKQLQSCWMNNFINDNELKFSHECIDLERSFMYNKRVYTLI